MQGSRAVDPGGLHHLLREPVGEEADHRVGELGDGRSVGLHPDRVDHRVGAATGGLLAHGVGEITVVLP